MTLIEETTGETGDMCNEWANVMQNVLNNRVNVTDKAVTLSQCRAKVPRPKKSVEVSKNKQKTLLRKEWASLGRKKPSFNEKDKEKRLRSIALSGVVQLFNAVRKQQNANKSKVSKSVFTEDETGKKVDKKSFLNLLLQKDRNALPDFKEEDKNDDKPPATWDVLRDDFMMSTKLKNWDTQEENPAQSN